MRMFERYTTTGFSSYEDFVKNFKINAPDDFNFAYDVMDVLAEEKPEKLALLWTNLEGDVAPVYLRGPETPDGQGGQFLL